MSAAWLLTAAISPRKAVRVAGEGNTYPTTTTVDAAPPAGPWAIYLTDHTRRYRLIGLDIDAPGGPADAAALAAADTAAITALLDRAHIAHLVCQSGPSGGRHIWIALTTPLPAEQAARFGRYLKATCAPRLDLAPITNPATGCLRPPGAPHRHGGASTVIAGHLDTLRRPATPAAAITALITQLAADIATAARTAPTPTDPTPDTGGDTASVHPLIARDDRGQPWLPGRRSALPDPILAAAHTRPDPDASAVLWTVLLSAAARHWTLAEVHHELAGLPGLAHLRSRRDRDRRRTARPATGPQSVPSVLARQWRRAVSHVATHRRSPRAFDPALDARALAVATALTGVQHRADAACGRWTRGGGGSDRSVLDALTYLCAQAITVDPIAADVRRLSTITGLGRATVGAALHRLAADGWIHRHAAAAGTRAAHWQISTPSVVTHRGPGDARPQGVTRAPPEGALPPPALVGLADRALLLAELGARLAAGCHDGFTGAALPPAARWVYGRLPDSTVALEHVVQLCGGHEEARAILGVLSDAGLLMWGERDQAVKRLDVGALDRYAAQEGLTGRLAARAATYAADRRVWAWWCAELAWMRAPRKGKMRVLDPAIPPEVAERLAAAQPWLHYPPFPRGADGRADHRAARALLPILPEITPARPAQTAPAAPRAAA